VFVNCGNPDCYHNTELDVSRFPDHLTYKTREFDEPIPVSKDRPLVTLRDAGDHITKLPKVDHTAAEWQAAIEALSRNVGRPNDVCAQRCHEGIEPPHRARIRSITERQASGTPQAGAAGRASSALILTVLCLNQAMNRRVPNALV